MSTFNELLVEILHQRHERDLSMEYDCETLADDIEEYINGKYVVRLEAFTHGRPYQFNCTFPDCQIGGHK